LVLISILNCNAKVRYPRQTRPFKIAPIVTVMLFLGRICSVSKIAFEWKAGPKLYTSPNYSASKKNYSKKVLTIVW